MINVLQVISDTNIGGAGRVLTNYLKYADREKFNIQVLLPKGSLLKPEIEGLGYPVIEVEGNYDKSFDLKTVSAIKKIVQEQNIDLIHTHASMSGKIAGRLAKIKVIYSRHCVYDPPKHMRSFPLKQVNGCLNNYLSDRIIAVARPAMENMVDTGISEKKMEVVFNGVEPLEALSKDAIKELKKKYQCPEDHLILGILARLEPVKGHRFFVETAKLAQDKQLPVTFLIAGKGGVEDDLRQQVKELQLTNVVFTGFVKNIGEVINILDYNVNCSYGTEATSMALLEGMSIGLPAIVSDYGGNPDVIEDGVNGFVIPQKDPEKLLKTIEYVLVHPEVSETLRKGSLDVFNKKFTAEIMARNTEAVYLKVLERK